MKLKAMMEASGREITLYSDAHSLLADCDRGKRFDMIFTDIVMEDSPAGMDLYERLHEEDSKTF